MREHYLIKSSYYFFSFTCICSCIANPEFKFNLTQENEFQLEFKGDLLATGVEHHHNIVVCADTGITKEQLRLCTHILVDSFLVINYDLSRVFQDENKQDQLNISTIRVMKLWNPRLKIITLIEVDESKTLEVMENPRKYNTLFATIYRFLRENELGGVIINPDENGKWPVTSSFSRFICALHDYLSPGGMEIWTIFSHWDKSINVIKSFINCVDNFFLVARKRLFLSPGFYNRLYNLDDSNNVNYETIFEKTTQFGVPPEKLIFAFQLFGEVTNDRSYVSGKPRIYSLCEANSANVTWNIFRHYPGKEVFITDERRWFSFEDMESVREIVMFVKNKGMGGVGFGINHYNLYGEICKNKTLQSSRIVHSIFLQINSQLIEHARAESSGAKQTEVTDGLIKVELPIDETCRLMEGLKMTKIHSEQYDTWLCIAQAERLTRRKLAGQNSSELDEKDCPTAKFGIFGLYSPICASTDENNEACSTDSAAPICEEKCEEFNELNISADISCLLKSISSNRSLYPASYLGCSNPTSTTTRTVFDFTKCYKHDGNLIHTTTIIGTIFAAFWGLVLSVTVIVIWRKQKVQKISTKDVVTKEIPSYKINIKTDQILGSGEYGTVFKGTVQGLVGEFAIKVANNGNANKLLLEMKILKKVENHANVVSLIATCSTNAFQGQAMIVLDLCEKGSLAGVLRDFRTNEREEAYIGNRSFIHQLLKWCLEIAQGMEYIASKKVIHGDLAARNVLITGEDMAKITDFGLSRHLYDMDSYVKSTREPMPVKWMSVESLKYATFTTKSDVWSYGVTVWEIFNLASVPYLEVPFSIPDLLDFLESGRRLNKPKLAPTDIYEEMVNCWHFEPTERHTFEELVELFRKHVYQACEDSYENIL